MDCLPDTSLERARCNVRELGCRGISRLGRPAAWLYGRRDLVRSVVFRRALSRRRRGRQADAAHAAQGSGPRAQRGQSVVLIKGETEGGLVSSVRNFLRTPTSTGTNASGTLRRCRPRAGRTADDAPRRVRATRRYRRRHRVRGRQCCESWELYGCNRLESDGTRSSRTVARALLLVTNAVRQRLDRLGLRRRRPAHEPAVLVDRGERCLGCGARGSAITWVVNGPIAVDGGGEVAG